MSTNALVRSRSNSAVDAAGGPKVNEDEGECPSNLPPSHILKTVRNGCFFFIFQPLDLVWMFAVQNI